MMPGDVRLLTVLVHFSTYDQYYAVQQRRQTRVREETLARFGHLPGVEALADRQAEFSWRPPHRFNDVAGFVEVVYDGGSRLLATAFVARDRKRFGEPTRAPRRDLIDKEFRWSGRVAETWLDHHPIRNADFQAGLREMHRQASEWARSHLWVLEFDDARINCTDWREYVDSKQLQAG